MFFFFQRRPLANLRSVPQAVMFPVTFSSLSGKFKKKKSAKPIHLAGIIKPALVEGYLCIPSNNYFTVFAPETPAPARNPTFIHIN